MLKYFYTFEQFKLRVNFQKIDLFQTYNLYISKCLKLDHTSRITMNGNL